MNAVIASYCDLSTGGYVRKSGVVASILKESPSDIFRGPQRRLGMSRAFCLEKVILLLFARE